MLATHHSARWSKYIQLFLNFFKKIYKSMHKDLFFFVHKINKYKNQDNYMWLRAQQTSGVI